LEEVRKNNFIVLNKRIITIPFRVTIKSGNPKKMKRGRKRRTRKKEEKERKRRTIDLCFSACFQLPVFTLGRDTQTLYLQHTFRTLIVLKVCEVDTKVKLFGLI
jgi:hypothetical protein